MTEGDFERFLPILKGIREISLKFDMVDEADLFSPLIDMAHLESPDFIRKLQSGAIWGSAGSIADTVLQYSATGPLEQLRRDDIERMRLLARLGDEMGAQGMLPEDIRIMTQGFNRFV